MTIHFCSRDRNKTTRNSEGGARIINSIPTVGG